MTPDEVTPHPPGLTEEEREVLQQVDDAYHQSLSWPEGLEDTLRVQTTKWIRGVLAALLTRDAEAKAAGMVAVRVDDLQLICTGYINAPTNERIRAALSAHEAAKANIGPQRAAPKSLAAVKAEVEQTRTSTTEASDA